MAAYWRVSGAFDTGHMHKIWQGDIQIANSSCTEASFSLIHYFFPPSPLSVSGLLMDKKEMLTAEKGGRNKWWGNQLLQSKGYKILLDHHHT